MTRTYAARRLLEHGPLTAPEILEITGWNHMAVWRALCELCACGVVVRRHVPGVSRQVYELA